MSSILLGLAALAASVNAHGHVSGIVADGVYYGGADPSYFYNAANAPENVGWAASNQDNGYVGGDQSTYDSPDIICHKEAKAGAAKATVAAGGTIEFQWNTWPESHIGPVITYAANCGGDCTAANKEELKWVKIDAKGLEGGKWAAVEMIANNNTWATTVPSTLAAGDYVFRHEIIALHSANNANGAQNYPQCVNVEVTGSGTENPEGTVGTALYTATDPGILYNPYGGATTYEIPGPALFGEGAGSGSAPAPAPSSSAAAPAPSSAAPAPSSAAPSAAPSVSAAPAPSASQPATQPKPSTLVTSSKPAPTSGSGSGAAVAKYGQCGGKEYTGATSCADNWTCKEQNPYYSQCVESA
ncbi:unnamed protein product [Periconia digitata]|uniref:CBM1 domain-containing protein n=1 Tax=Periconia digitata TaxID=1303443 RepID=A0A9W4UJN8_9PLEO|nr:unnamed protein product [Periconia digitata]